LKLDVLQLDVDDADSSEMAARKVLDQAGLLDVLVNNAGISGGGAVGEVPEATLRGVFETNFSVPCV
jgi:NAD(P)-dependent dehydrogenase (short-subunit alcohol dehydrogenase family)